MVGADCFSLSSNPTRMSANEGDAALSSSPWARPNPSRLSQSEGFSGLLSGTAPMEDDGLPVSGCVSLGVVTSRHMVMTDASLLGWEGGLSEVRAVKNEGDSHMSSPPINFQELLTCY